MRHFVIIGTKATASPEFSLVDIAGTSGRLDVLLRCLRSALMISHGLRRDTVVYLVLLGSPRAPRSVRIDGATARFLRPDERSLAVLLQKALACSTEGETFVTVRPGVAIADAGIQAVLADIGPCTPYLVEENAPDVRSLPLDGADPVFFLGDHIGFDDATRAAIAGLGAQSVGVGPLSLHAGDAIVLLANELDRREAPRVPPTSCA